ncbi:MAG: SPOR domain-containing protein [Proteobacteria bacterium]|nr:SPOR domain-containing protein [Pseudomonadota bacterium]
MKERIIGAAVLVVFVVLVVPIFLDGPPDDDEIVSERVLLPGQEAQKTQTVVLDRNRTEPVPAAGAAAPAGSDAPVETPVAEQAKPAVVRQPDPKPGAEPASDEPPAAAGSAPASSTTGMWAVQLGSFSNKNNAEKLAADLRKQDYAAFLSQLRTGSGVMHRVRIGPQKDRASSEAMAARLAKVGHDGKVVPHP